jgi:hypothetical protein
MDVLSTSISPLSVEAEVVHDNSITAVLEPNEYYLCTQNAPVYVGTVGGTATAGTNVEEVTNIVNSAIEDYDDNRDMAISQFTNDAGYIAGTGGISQFTNDVGYVTMSALPTTVLELSDSGSYLRKDSNNTYLDATATIKVSKVESTTFGVTTLTANTLHAVSETGISNITSSGNIHLNAASGGGSVYLNAANMVFKNGSIQNSAYEIVDIPISSKGASGDKLGMIAVGSTGLYYCTADYTGNNANIWKKIAWDVTSW